MTLETQNEYFSQRFIQKLQNDLMIENKSVFAYLPESFQLFELTDFCVVLNELDDGKLDKEFVEATSLAYIYTFLSLKLHLLDSVKPEDHHLEFAVLGGDFFGGKLVDAFLAYQDFGTMKEWIKKVNLLQQRLTFKKFETLAQSFAYIQEEMLKIYIGILKGKIESEAIRTFNLEEFYQGEAYLAFKKSHDISLKDQEALVKFFTGDAK